LIVLLDKEDSLYLAWDEEVSSLYRTAEIEEIHILNDEGEINLLLCHLFLKAFDSFVYLI